MRFCTSTSFDLQPELETDLESKIMANVENILETFCYMYRTREMCRLCLCNVHAFGSFLLHAKIRFCVKFQSTVTLSVTNT